MKEILYGSNDKEPHTETVAQLAQELYNSGLLIALVENLQVIDFEVRREEVFSESLLNHKLVLQLYVCVFPGEEGCVSDLQQHLEEADWDEEPHCRILLFPPRGPLYTAERVRHTHTHNILYILYSESNSFQGRDTNSVSSQRYETPQVALNCGIMLRECIRHEPLAKIVLLSDHFHSFFNYVEMSTFDIASDAFATFKVPRLFLL